MSEKKSPVGKIIGFGCLGLFILAILCGGGGVFMMSKIMKSNEPYTSSIAAAQGNAAVVEALGEPVKPGFLPSGNISVDGASGEVNLAIGISGPKGKGTIYVEGEKSAGNWNYTVREVEIAGQADRIPLGQ